LFGVLNSPPPHGVMDVLKSSRSINCFVVGEQVVVHAFAEKVWVIL